MTCSATTTIRHHFLFCREGSDNQRNYTQDGRSPEDTFWLIYQMYDVFFQVEAFADPDWDDRDGDEDVAGAIVF